MAPTASQRAARGQPTQAGGQIALYRLTLAFAASLALAVSAQASSAHKHPIHCGANHACIEHVAKTSCLTRRDDWHCRIFHRWQDVLQARVAAASAPAPAVTPGLFERCVANREAGSPGATTLSTIDWTIDTGNGYYGAFQWLPSTWTSVLHMMAARGIDTDGWPSMPNEASESQQVAAFDFYEPIDPGAWPVTVPACGG